ncbi:alpha/beta hydrolase domain-containing protein [Nonomuraea sediminis]|uniref:alpha/beta hydrolase domain-containing protein n=1 Tax=Nonomuraea sediminis TaxID=2835864 RepID=UPI001BDCD9F6|nr:alpha/beta hydrolase domain-containing protein [Nonomuraea sediminis]
MRTALPDLQPSRGGRGRPFGAARNEDADHGYIEEEYLLSGTATAYRDDPAEPGQVGVRAHAPYVTRVLVRTPEPRERFNGTVVVEWFNVSGFMDAGVEWLYTHTELIRGGYAWVGVSAQCAGVTGSALPPDGAAPGGLKAWDHDRYGTLYHPGDDYSYDIFSQAGHAIAELFPGARLIAAGVSLAAYRLTTYINKIDPIARAYHGYLTHSRIGAASLLVLPDPPQMDPRPVPFRDDLRVPVLALLTETDLITLDYLSARQPDGPCLRVWEIAGTAHADTYSDAAASHDMTRLEPARMAAALAPRERAAGFELGHTVNAAPQHHYVANAAIHHLARWVHDGTPPPHAPRLDTRPGPPPAIRRDGLGNALGGIRTPWMDAPTAVLTGISPNNGLIERLFGQTVPFTGATLAQLYPGGAGDYLAAFGAATDAAVAEGFLLEADTNEIKDLAAAAYQAESRKP